MTKLPSHLKEKVLSFPEYQMGVHRISLILKGDVRIHDVLIAWGDDVVKVGGRTELGDLRLGDVVDVADESRVD
jgi:hypothetical protein